MQERWVGVPEINVDACPYDAVRVGPYRGFQSFACVDQGLCSSWHQDSELRGLDHDLADFCFESEQEVFRNQAAPDLAHANGSGGFATLLGDVDKAGIHDPRPSGRGQRAFEGHRFGFADGLLESLDLPALLAFQHAGEVLGAETGFPRASQAGEAHSSHRRVRLGLGCIVALRIVRGVSSGSRAPGLGSTHGWTTALWLAWKEQLGELEFLFLCEVKHFSAERHDCFAVCAVLKHPPGPSGSQHDVRAARWEGGLHLRLNAFKERLVFSMLPQPEACHELVICSATPGYVGEQEPPHGPLKPASC